jgi:hypothetical protein
VGVDSRYGMGVDSRYGVDIKVKSDGADRHGQCGDREGEGQPENQGVCSRSHRKHL